MHMGLMDYKNSVTKKIFNQDKADPGTFSFMEPGWWVLHAMAISGVYMLGQYLTKNRHY